MQVHELIQGSPEWLAFRAEHFGASEAAAMLGLSKTTTRPELLHIKATGLTPEFTAWVQKNVLDHGHHVEDLTLPLIEKHIGDDLYPATYSEGKLSASCDGITMSGDYAWENKQPNAEIVAQMKAGQVPPQHMPQCQQVLMVTGAKKLIFSVCDGTPENLLTLDVWPDTGWFERLRAGWAQFEIDLAAYEPPAAAAPIPTGRAPETLPALFIAVKGEVTDSNLTEFKEVALAAIRSVNRDLQNDQDFADAEKAVKWCDDIEKRVAGAKQHALSQTATIDSLFKTMDDISAEARQVRLDLEKLVKARKVSLKTEMLTEAQTALGDHIRALNTRLGRDYMPQVPVDFAGTITSKRNFDSMRAALDATLANAKIAANATADKIDTNLKVLRAHEADYKFLFADVAQIVLKAPDDLQALVTLRISEHQAEVARKEEATRERIRAEEVARIEREQAEEAERNRITAERGTQQVLKAEAATPDATDRVGPAISSPCVGTMGAGQPADAGPTWNVVSMRAAAPASATPPTLKLGQIGERLGFSLTGDFLKNLGFEPAARDKSALLFHESNFVEICDALDDHITSVRAKFCNKQAA
jgi:predicted phage-related endonuclease